MGRTRAAMAVLVVAAAAGGGCGDDGSPRPAATTTPAPQERPSLDGCVEDGGGIRVQGPRAAVGRGATGVVAVPGPGGDACQWLPLARDLARRGLRVQLSETGAGDEVAEVVANVRRLRREGARRVTLLSTSAGGSTALQAARRAGRAVTAVVTLSAVRYSDGDALAVARRLSIPLLHIGSRGDPATSEGRDTRQLGAARRAIVVGGAGHGVDVVADHPQLTGRIASFLRDPR
jgi:pimeloyl-ACP methyl ester carboxylesterase